MSHSHHELQRVSSLPKAERKEEEFTRNIAVWFSDKEQAKPWLLALPTEEADSGNIPPTILKAVKLADTGHVNDAVKKVLEWRKELAERTAENLKPLYFRYGILPASVLAILADFAAAAWQLDKDAWKKLRSRKAREKDAKILEKAAEIVAHYWPFLSPPREETAYDADGLSCHATLERLTKDIRELFPLSQRHRPKELELILFARELAGYFFRVTERPLYEYVGKLLLATFPGEWNPADDIREATKKLVKAGIGAEEDLRYMAEHLVGHFNHTTRMAEEYWGKKGKVPTRGKASRKSVGLKKQNRSEIERRRDR